MHIMFVCSELAPLCQSGGLGDATSGLARALGAQGHEVTVVLPAYRTALASKALPPLVDGGSVKLAWQTAAGAPFDLLGRFLCGPLFPGVEVCLLDIPALYDRPGLYGEGPSDYPDNAQRFIALCRAAAYRVEALHPDVVVAHDWHAALTLAMLRTSLDRGACRSIGTVQVVHNNAHQGRYSSGAMAFTGLAPDLLHVDGVEAWGSLCLLKGGLMWADRIVAVSPTYAQEIQTSAFGEGLEGAYRARAARLMGICNGIDAQRFDPLTDRALPAPFSAADLAGKGLCREALLSACGLVEPLPGLLCAAIGRLAGQKGWDVIVDSIEPLLARGASLVFLGDGSQAIAAALQAAAREHPTRVFFRSAYDDALARRIYAGADVMLVPSRFEPCGLVQLIAQRYGTVPVAHATGGLADTIHDPPLSTTNPRLPGKPTGVLFAPLSAANLVSAVARVAKLAASGGLPATQQRLLSLDVSWDGPAQVWAGMLADVVRDAQKR